MLRLTTFGGVALVRDGVPVVGAATAPRRLALLVLVAAAGARGLTREALAALMWPDSDDEAGRHSLHQALYTVRNAVGVEDLFLGATTLYLNPARVECDLWEFEAAVRGRSLELAVSLYRGAFADGFSIRGAPEVERRLDVARSGFARDFATALETLARAAAERGDHATSARWWHRLVDEDRLSARAARELIAALVASGETLRALQFALVHEALVRQETGRGPHADILNWIRRLRADEPDAKRLTPVPTGPRSTIDFTEAGEALRRRHLARVAGALGRRYRIDRLLESGGIMESYAAAAVIDLNREVEVHILRPRVVAMSSADRFVTSLQRTVSLLDPRILSTLEVGLVDDLLFFITARRGAPTLRERLRHERALSLRDALSIGRAVIGALAHAHAGGVHHGDLRPKHITFFGESAVTDGFGIAEALSSEPDMNGRTTMVSLGSPAYMSPEQLSGDAHVDVRSDVYAFGSVLYEMLAGEPPFGRNSPSVIGRKLTEPPTPLRRHRDSVPAAIEDIVHRCLMRVPADRYASAAEVAQTLASLESLVLGPV